MSAAPPASLDDAALLRLIWLASPALPIGGFSYSEGLEAALDSAAIGDAASIGEWLADQLHLALGRSDLPVVARAVDAWRHDDRPALHALDAWIVQTRESAELLLQTQQMGRSFVEWLKLHHDDAEAIFDGWRPTHPVAFAFGAQRAGVAPPAACLAYAFGWAENMVAAAIKAAPLGQSAGQRILAQLCHEIPRVVALATPLDALERQSFCPMLAIVSSRHETQYSRLFRS